MQHSSLDQKTDASSAEGKVKIAGAHLYLVPAAKGAPGTPRITSVDITPDHELFARLAEVYQASDRECCLPVVFRAAKQENACRSLLLDYVRNPDLGAGLPLAQRLAKVTTNRSRNALLCLAHGVVDGETKLLVARFPGDQGIHAVPRDGGLRVRYLKRLFMRNARGYKAVVYKGRSLKADFWEGSAVDKQVNSRDVTISNYWIADFLDSDLKTTGKAGTRRLAMALRQAARKAPLAIKRQLVSAIELSAAAAGKTLSAREFCTTFGFSAETIDAVRKQFRSDELFEEKFRFSDNELRIHIAYKYTELDNGAILMADAHHFKQVFEMTPDPRDADAVTVSTAGKIVDEGMRKQKV